MNKIVLNNRGVTNAWYPRLQINKLREIVLALFKEDTLTTGILVGKSPSQLSE